MQVILGVRIRAGLGHYLTPTLIPNSRRISYGAMVACENPDCAIEWFHFECVGLKTEVMQFHLPSLHTLISLIKSCFLLPDSLRIPGSVPAAGIPRSLPQLQQQPLQRIGRTHHERKSGNSKGNRQSSPC
jgi:hypothetical protein